MPDRARGKVNPQSAIRNPQSNSHRRSRRLAGSGHSGPDDLPMERRPFVGVDAGAVGVGGAGGAHFGFLEVLVAGGADLEVARVGGRLGEAHPDLAWLLGGEAVS